MTETYITMNMYKYIKGIAFVIILMTFSSCLTVEKKEYTYEITGNNSGRLTIKFINIYSIMDEGNDVSAEDFKELVDTYLNGDQIAQDFPAATNIKKRLFEENGQLCGEVTLDFPFLDAARLYQLDSNSPIMMCISAAYDSETYLSSNGKYGNDHMPVVFWPAGTKKMQVTTGISSPDETSVNLVELYKAWSANK